MSAVYEYGERKEQNGIKKGMENVILRLYYNGIQAEKIDMNTGMELNTIQEIINKYEEINGKINALDNTEKENSKKEETK